ncbi:hypothetical protein V8F33_000863 [Rhypophila sp. PSN 637]
MGIEDISVALLLFFPSSSNSAAHLPIQQFSTSCVESPIPGVFRHLPLHFFVSFSSFISCFPLCKPLKRNFQDEDTGPQDSLAQFNSYRIMVMNKNVSVYPTNRQ